jgi:hypothetical protein
MIMRIIIVVLTILAAAAIGGNASACGLGLWGTVRV